MKYIWTRALCNGWGCVGVWPAHLVENAERKMRIPILDENDMIVGQGGGWDSPGTFDNEWMIKACELMSRYNNE